MAAAHSRIATALAAVALFAAVCVSADHGAARAAVGQATGPLIGSSLAGAAILQATGLAPGHVKVGEITVTNVGDVSGTFALASSGLVDTPLGRKLDLVVEDVTPGQTVSTVYYGKLSGLSTVGLGDMAQGEAHRYRFTVSLAADADNSYQGGASAVAFMWTATGEEPAPAPAPAPAPDAGKATPQTPKATSPKATTKALGATLTARARQTAAKGRVRALVTCTTGCRIELGGSATVERARVLLHKTVRTFSTPARLQMQVRLPARARQALARRHPVVVHLRLRATAGTRVVTVRRTVRITPASR